MQLHIKYTNFHSTKWLQNIGHFFRPQCVDSFLPSRRPLSGATSAHSGHVPDDYDRILQEISGDFSRMEASVDVSTNPDHFMPDTWYWTDRNLYYHTGVNVTINSLKPWDHFSIKMILHQYGNSLWVGSVSMGLPIMIKWCLHIESGPGDACKTPKEDSLRIICVCIVLVYFL